MKNVFIGILSAITIALTTNLVIVKKSEENCKKQNISLLQKEYNLRDTLDIWYAEAIYYYCQRNLDHATTLSDLVDVVWLINSYDSTNLHNRIIGKSYPELIGRLSELGIKFFASEVRTISSQQELKNFQEKVLIVESITPIYFEGTGLNDATVIFWKKIEKYK